MAFNCFCDASTVLPRVLPYFSDGPKPLNGSFVFTLIWLMSPQVPAPKAEMKSGPNAAREQERHVGIRRPGGADDVRVHLAGIERDRAVLHVIAPIERQPFLFGD